MRQILLIILLFLLGCDSNLKVKTRDLGGAENPGQPGQSFSVEKLIPVAAKDGEKVVIQGKGLSDNIDFQLDNGTPLDVVIVSGTEAYFIMPPGHAVGKFSVVGSYTSQSVEVPFFALGEGNLPFFTGSASDICSGIQFYNAIGDIKTGTKKCSAIDLPFCTEDGEISCVTHEEYKAANMDAVSQGNIKNGVVIAGVTGSAILESHGECANDGEVGCVAVATYKAVDMSNVVAGNIKQGVTIAGTGGSLVEESQRHVLVTAS